MVTALIALSACLVVASFAVKARLRGQAHVERKPELDRTAFILALVLCEAAALLGLVARFTTGSPHYYVSLLIGFVGILLHYPKREQSTERGY